VSNGALINLSRAAGSMSGTPLHLAALNGNYGIVKYLVENGAELNPLGDVSMVNFMAALGVLSNPSSLCSFKRSYKNC